MERQEQPHVKFMGVKINNIPLVSLKDEVQKVIRNKGKGYICVTDVGNVIGATKDYELLHAINTSIFSVADGMPLVWYARMLRCRAIKRISGADLMAGLISQKNGYRHFLLGDTDETIKRVSVKAKELNRDAVITGYSPPFREFTESDTDNIFKRIAQEDPDIIWVSFGGGKQEKWMKRTLPRLERGIMIGVGAAFRWLIGDLITPPKVFQALGLQWAFRIGQQMFKNPVVCIKALIAKEILKKKLLFLFYLPFEVITERRKYH